MATHPDVLRAMDLEAGRGLVRNIPSAAVHSAKLLVEEAVASVGRHAVQFPGRERLNRGLQQRGLHAPGQSDPWKRTMGRFKTAGVVVTTPSSGTYVVERIGNVGQLFDLLQERVACLESGPSLMTTTNPPGALVSTFRDCAKTREESASLKPKPKPKPQNEPLAKKETKELSKTPAAVAAAKRRKRIKAEKLAEKLQGTDQEMTESKRLKTGGLSPAHVPAHGASVLLHPEHAAGVIGDPRLDENLPGDNQVERDVAEAAEAMGILKPAPAAGLFRNRDAQRLGLPPDSCAAPAEETETETKVPAMDPVADAMTPRTAQREQDQDQDQDHHPSPSAADLWRQRVRDAMLPGAVFAFDAKEAGNLLLFGWDNVLECVVRRVTARGVDVACRTRASDGKFFGNYRVPMGSVTSVLVERTGNHPVSSSRPVPVFPHPCTERVVTPRAPLPPLFPSGGSSERKRLASRAQNVADAILAGPSTGVLARRAFAATNASLAAGDASSVFGVDKGTGASAFLYSQKRQRPSSRDELRSFSPPRVLPSAPRQRDAFHGNAFQDTNLGLLRSSLLVFRDETNASLAAIRGSVDRLASALATVTGAELLDRRPPRNASPPRDSQTRTRATPPAVLPPSPDAPFKGSAFNGSSFMSDARALATFRDSQRADVAYAAATAALRVSPSQVAGMPHVYLSGAASVPKASLPEPVREEHGGKEDARFQTPNGLFQTQNKEDALFKTPNETFQHSGSKSFEFDVPPSGGGGRTARRDAERGRSGGAYTTATEMGATPESPLEEGEIRG